MPDSRWTSQAIARICALGFGMRVLAFTRSGVVPRVAEGVRAAASIGAVLEESDFVVLACPLTPQTRGLIGVPELARMRRGAILINVARGPVVQHDALLAALKDGQIAGAALDVFDTQPLPDDDPLWDQENVLITPHVAGITDEACAAWAKARRARWPACCAASCRRIASTPRSCRPSNSATARTGAAEARSRSIA